MNETVTTFLTLIGGSAVFGGLAGGLVMFLFKTVISERIKGAIQHEYNEKFETFKVQLKSESDAEIEHLRSQLQIAAAERQFQYSKSFEKTADIIVKIYQKLVELRQLNDSYTTYTGMGMDDPQKDERQKYFDLLKRNWAEFSKFYNENKIYIPKDTAKSIFEFSHAMWAYQSKCSMIPLMEKARRMDVIDNFYAQIAKYNEEIPRLMGKLEDKFQEILGLDKVTNKKPTLSEPQSKPGFPEVPLTRGI